MIIISNLGLFRHLKLMSLNPTDPNQTKENTIENLTPKL